MTPLKTLLSASALLSLGAFLACGGGGGSNPPPPPPPPTATTLTYTDPASGTYKLVKNAATTSTHLILDLVGPAATGTGVSITLSADTTRLTWVDVPPGGTTGTLAQNGTQFVLGGGTPILKARATGGVLQATVAQKGLGSPVPLNGPLLRVALDLKAGGPQGAVTLSADAAKCQVLDNSGAISPITVSVGSLIAQ